jgi:hypothetical protein
MNAEVLLMHRRKKPGDDDWRKWATGAESGSLAEDFANNPTLVSVVRRYSDGHAYEWRRAETDSGSTNT